MNPKWLLAFETIIQKILEVAPENFIIRVLLYDNCQFHHHAPNPFLNDITRLCNNDEGYRHFYDIPLYKEVKGKKIKEGAIFVDAIMGVVSKYPGKIQISIGNELTTKTGIKDAIEYVLPSDSLYPGYHALVLGCCELFG
jgi:hypothetical protein